MNLKALLDVEIEERSMKLAKLDPGTKEYSDAVEGLAKLIDRRIEIEKLELSEAQTEKQMKAEHNDRVVRYIIDSGKVILPLGTAVGMSLLAYTFEAKGVVPVGIGKKWVEKLTKY